MYEYMYDMTYEVFTFYSPLGEKRCVLVKEWNLK